MMLYNLRKYDVYIYQTAIMIVFFITRLLFLDSDLPAWGMVHYASIDEGAYGSMALNYINYGTINPNEILEDMEYFITGQSINIVVGNIIAYLGLSCIGDTYYGLRVPFVLVNLLNIVLFIAVLNKIRIDYGSRERNELYWILFFELALVLDFFFTVSGRVLEPTSLRLTCVMLLMLVWCYIKNNVKFSFFSALLITLSVFYIYMTNTYLYIALTVYLLVNSVKLGYKKISKCFIAACIGVLVGLFFSEIYYHIVWNKGAVANILETVSSFGSNGSEQYTAAGAYLIFKHIVRYISSDILLYNLPMLFIFIILLPKFASAMYRNIRLCFPVSVLLGLLIQTMVTEDYIVRKFLMIYPVMLVIIYYCVITVWNNNNERILKLFTNARMMFVGSIICTAIYYYRLYLIKDGTAADFTGFEKAWLLLAVIIILGYVLKRIEESIDKKVFCRDFAVLIGIGIILNVGLSVKNIYFFPTYGEKNIMLKIRDYGDSYILGEYVGGYTLYNDIKPVVNDRDILAEYMIENKEYIFFDYGDDYFSYMRDFFDNIMFCDKEYSILPIQHYDRDYQLHGQRRPMGLYRIVLKKDVLPYYQALQNRGSAIKDEIDERFIEKKLQDDTTTYEETLKEYNLEDWQIGEIFLSDVVYYYEQKKRKNKYLEYIMEERKSELIKQKNDNKWKNIWL